VSKCDNRPVSSRIAEPATFPNRCWARVAGVGDGEFRRNQNRLAGLNAQLSRSLSEPSILALVVLHDPIQTVAGMERAFAHHPGLIRLNSES
jgi:hypothetical protein